MIAIVTLKYSLGVKHDPQNKKAGNCPVGLCSDRTGGHHSRAFTIPSGMSLTEAERLIRRDLVVMHITRIEFTQERIIS